MSAPAELSVVLPDQPDSGSGSVVGVRHAADGVHVDVTFDADGAPRLPVGRAGKFEFRSGADPVHGVPSGSVVALGKIVQRNDRPEVRTYECLFGDRTRQRLVHLLEPRRAYRVYPDDSEPVRITIALPGSTGGIVATARDVSTSGIGVMVPWGHEQTLCDAEELTIQVTLPGATEYLAFEGQIVNRSLGEASIVYGLQFTDIDSATDPRLARVAEYVRSRGGSSAIGA